MGESAGRLGPDSESHRPVVSLSSLMDSSPVPTMVIDLAGRLELFNRAARSMLDLNDQDLGKPVAESSFGPKVTGAGGRFKDEFEDALRCTMEKGQCLLKAAVHLSSRDSRTFHMMFTILKDEEGRDAGVLIKLKEIASINEDAETLSAPLEILAKTSSGIIDSDDLAGTISNELGKLTESLDLDFAIFRLTTPEGNVSMICHGVDFRQGREILEAKLKDDGPLYESVLKGDLFISEQVPNDPRFASQPQGVHSFLCLTIRWMKKIYGCAVFGSMLPGSKIRAHIPVLQVFCNQVAISIRNVSLWKELAGRNTELRALYETSRAVSGTLELKEVLMIIIQNSKSLVNAGNCSIFSMDGSGKMLRCVAYIGENPELTEGVELRVGEGITGLVAQRGEGMLIERADLDDRAILIAGSRDAPSSLISVPLKISDRTVGVMTLERVLGAPFSQKEYQLMEMFSVQAATAINNASMYALQKSTASNLQMYNTLLTHDVANFNVPIHSYLEMLLKDPKLDDRQRRYVWNALVQSENITDLVSDVRELTRLKGRMGERPLESMDLIPIMNEAIGDIQANPLYGDVEVVFDSSIARRAMVQCDTFLKSLFYNLLSNACKYGGGSEVHVNLVACQEDGEEAWRVEVSDRGKGIPDDRKSQLFKRFDQLDKEQGADGHGIGLSVVRALCDRYEGRVWVQDRVSGDYRKGSVFVVVLPKSKAESTSLHSTGLGGELAGVK